MSDESIGRIAKMRFIQYVIGILGIVLCMAACHYPASLPQREKGKADSLRLNTPRPYALNSNFEVTADSLWLYQLPFTDSVKVSRGDRLVVAEFAVHRQEKEDSVWVKVARDQETIGWLCERSLLENIVPADPISKCIHWFSNTHTVPFFIILGLFFLWTVLGAVRRKQIKLLGLNDIDSVYPVLLTWLLASAAVLYNSMLYFVPQTWEQYYYDPSLNPFELPFILGLFLLTVGLIAVAGIAVLDDLFHQTTLEIAFFYLVGLTSCCIFLYIFFTYIWVYLAYLCWIGYSLWCAVRLRKASSYPYACGACGAKMRTKGICPHCGALNQ